METSSNIDSYTRFSGLAVLAGIFSVPCVITGPFALIPLLFAVLALRQISRAPDLRGKYVAIFAIVLSVLRLAGTKLHIDAAEKALENAAFFQAETNAYVHAHAVLAHMDSTQDRPVAQEQWPDLLIQEGFIDPAMLVSIREGGEDTSYVYLADFEPWDEESIMLYEDPEHWERGVIVAFGDGNIEVIPHDEFERLLSEHAAGKSP